ncbi:MAG: multicopper oxidase family protein [Actinomycetes bacterium]
MRPISRRQALALGGLGLASVAVGTLALSTTAPGGTPPGPAGGAATWREPAELRSVDGLLDARLDAGPVEIEVGGARVSALGYGGSVPGPTLRVAAGDRIRLALRNDLGAATNLHTHGLHVSPRDNGDNPFVSIGDGESFDYEFDVPADHPPGVYWYHPHLHGSVADQIFAGLYGAIIIDDPKAAEGVRERVMIVSDLSIDAAGRIRSAGAMDRMMGREGELVLLNGMLAPVIEARPGSRERWRIVNACVSRHLRLRVDGHRLDLVAIDSGRRAEPERVEAIDLAPGNRADVLVTIGPSRGAVTAQSLDRGGMGMMGGSRPSSGSYRLASIELAGERLSAADSTVGPAPAADLREVAVDRSRVIEFGMTGMMGRFVFDGRSFDASRVDISAAAGTVEEWTLRNGTGMDHPFHLHVWPMQVVERGGTATTVVDQREVVAVPARGEVVVRVAFTGFTGRSVYHCHILDHEDGGMMGVIDVR